MKRLAVLIIAMASLFGATKTNAQVAVGISVEVAPPAIPVYAQPPCPMEGYLWTPGYWYWGTGGYFWVPGVWVRPARVGWLWTPGYWGWEGGHYWWHGGYWGEHVGYYGGINYGCGYVGSGFCGGRWEGGAFRYNTAAWQVGGGFHNTYVDRTVINNTYVSRSSYNGPGGVMSQPSREERTYMRDQHMQATSEQQSHEYNASSNRNQFASVNHGNPSTMARGSVGGQEYNSSGNAMHSNNGYQSQHGGVQNAGSYQARQHGGSMQNGGAMQAQHGVQNAGSYQAQQQHGGMQNRGAMQAQHGGMQNGGGAQHQPQGGSGGGQAGGGGSRERH